ncbi:hypothetical protein HK102_008599, partial [Quaeritorhiza haematococci]
VKLRVAIDSKDGHSAVKKVQKRILRLLGGAHNMEHLDLCVTWVHGGGSKRNHRHDNQSGNGGSGSDDGHGHGHGVDGTGEESFQTFDIPTEQLTDFLLIIGERVSYRKLRSLRLDLPLYEHIIGAFVANMPRLESIALGQNAQILDIETVRGFSRCPRLTRLTMGAHSVTQPEVVTFLARNCPGLTKLTMSQLLDRTQDSNARIIKTIAESFAERLMTLEFTSILVGPFGDVKLTLAFAEVARRCPNLTELNM